MSSATDQSETGQAGGHEASAFWILGPGEGALRTERIRQPGADEVLVETIASGISRGTETLVFQGLVPKSQYKTMQAPFQEGSFGFPIKYGYCSVGRVVEGPEELEGERVFCLYPHQDRYVVGVDNVVPVPKNVASQRAVLAANMETAINALWDAPLHIGSRLAVIGCGVVGGLIARLAADHPGVEVEMIDINPQKSSVARALDLPFVAPDAAQSDVDLVIHASGHPDGLRTAFEIAGFEATILDVSWYGDREVGLPLGENFHSHRLKLISSQVGAIAPSMRHRRNYRQRMTLALTLLADERFDSLVAAPRQFNQLPTLMPELVKGGNNVMCQLITYR